MFVQGGTPKSAKTPPPIGTKTIVFCQDAAAQYNNPETNCTTTSLLHEVNWISFGYLVTLPRWFKHSVFFHCAWWVLLSSQLETLEVYWACWLWSDTHQCYSGPPCPVGHAARCPSVGRGEIYEAWEGSASNTQLHASWLDIGGPVFDNESIIVGGFSGFFGRG